jgi:hypothetical protein
MRRFADHEKTRTCLSHKSVSERRTQYPRRSLTRRSVDGVLRVRCGSHPCARARRGGKRALGAWFNLSRCSPSREPPGAKPEARQRQRQANAPIGAKRDRHSRLLGAFGDDEIGDRTDQSEVSGKVELIATICQARPGSGKFAMNGFKIKTAGTLLTRHAAEWQRTPAIRIKRR